MDTLEPTTMFVSDEQIQVWRTELAQCLTDYDAIATPIRAQIEVLEAELAAKTAASMAQIRTFKALIKHSEPYSYVRGDRWKGIEEREITISRERHAELTARWGPHISSRFGVSFNEFIASLDGIRAFGELSDLQDWWRHPHWWPVLFGEVSEEEGREALMWLLHQLKFQHEATNQRPPVGPYVY